MPEILIGLDIGTTKLCAVAFEPASGRLLAVEDAPNTAAAALPPPAVEEDAEALVRAGVDLVAQVVGGLVARRRDIAGLGVTGQMHGVVLADADGRTVSPFVTWRDGRGAAPAGDGATLAEVTAERLGPDAALHGGCRLATGYGGVTLFRWAREGLLAPGATALTIMDLVVRRLTGRACTDPTDAAGWGLFDTAHGGRWLPGAASALGLPPDLLPPVLPTGTRAGELVADAAAETGLAAGLPVAVGLGDNQACFFGSVPALAGTLLVNLGTGGQVSIATDGYLRAPGLEVRPLAGARRLLTGASLCGGRAYAALAAFFREAGAVLFGADGIDDGALYERMNRLAADAPADAAGLEAEPCFAGTRQAPDRRGTLRGIDLDNLRPGPLCRAMLTGMVDELLAFADRAADAGVRAERLVGSGNAVRRNPVVRGILEARTGLPLGLPPLREEAALGAALAGGVAAACFADWDSAVAALPDSLDSPDTAAPA